MDTAPCELCRRVFDAKRLHLDFVPLIKGMTDFTRMLCDSCYLGVTNGRLTREGADYRLKGDSEQARD
jgi:hypothetical protein